MAIAGMCTFVSYGRRFALDIVTPRQAEGCGQCIPYAVDDEVEAIATGCWGTLAMLNDDLPSSQTASAQLLTTVSVHAGSYLAHDLASAMPLVCRGVRKSIPGETLWERTARALQNVQPREPYPNCDVLTVFVHDNDALTARFDVEITSRGAIASIVIGGVPRITHAPICVDRDDDIVEVACKIFAAGLPR